MALLNLGVEGWRAVMWVIASGCRYSKSIPPSVASLLQTSHTKNCIHEIKHNYLFNKTKKFCLLQCESFQIMINPVQFLVVLCVCFVVVVVLHVCFLCVVGEEALSSAVCGLHLCGGWHCRWVAPWANYTQSHVTLSCYGYKKGRLFKRAFYCRAGFFHGIF